MNKWKCGFAGILLAAAVCLYAGCSSKSNKVTLRLIGMGDVSEAVIIQNLIKEFNKSHPDVEVQSMRVPYNEYITKILTQFSGGLAPDVMAVSAEQMAAFSSRGVLIDLKPYIDKDPSLKLSDFYPEVIDYYMVNGQLQTLPRDIAPVGVVYYNKKKFDEAGLAYPKNDWTQEQFLAACMKLTKKDAKGNVEQFAYVDDWPNYEGWIYTYGGSLVDDVKHPTHCTIDTTNAIEGVQFRADLINKYKVMVGPSNVTAMGGAGNSDLFLNGRVAMYSGGIWKVPEFRNIKSFDWDVVEFPTGPKGKRGFPLSATGYGIVKTCKNPEVAYELVKYLAGPEGQKLMAATGLTQPAMKTLADSPAFLDTQIPQGKKFLVNAVKDGHFRPFDANATEWLDMMGTELAIVWLGTETPEAALTKLNKTINEKFYKK